MLKRLVPVLIVVAALVAAIAYSQLRPLPLNVSGIIEADEIRLGSRVGGRVLSVHVQEGGRVQQGDILVRLEPFDLEEQEKQATENVAARMRPNFSGFKAVIGPKRLLKQRPATTN